MVRKGEFIEQMIAIIRDWPDDWPTHNDVYFELKRRNNKITQDRVSNLLNKYLRHEFHKRLDAGMQKRVVRTATLSFSSKAVLFAVQDGYTTTTSIIRHANKTSKEFSPYSYKIRPVGLPRYLGQLKELAKTDKEVEEILKKLKS